MASTDRGPRSVADLEAELDRQTALAGLGLLGTAGSNLQNVMDQATREVAALLRVPSCVVLELVPDGSEFLLRAGVGIAATGPVAAGPESWAGVTVLTGAPVIVEDLRTDPRFDEVLLRQVGVVSGLSVVIGDAEHPVGILAIYADECRFFDTRDIDLVGSVAHILGSAVLRDRAEVVLVESEQRYRALLDDLSVGVLIQGPNAEVLAGNPAALDLLGLDEDQLLRRTSFDPRWDVIHEDGSAFPGPTHPVPQAIETRAPVHDVVMGVLRPGSEERVWLLVNADPRLTSRGDVAEVVCTFQDITRRRVAELERDRTLAELRQSRERLRVMVEVEPECVKVLTRAGTLLEMNRAGLAMLEADRADQLVGTSILGIIAPEHRDAFLSLIQRAREEASESLQFEIVGLKGTRRWLETRAVALPGDPNLVLELTRDITEQRRASRELQDAEARYRTLVEQVPVIIYDWHVDRDVDHVAENYISPQIERILGFAPEEWLADPNLWLARTHPDDRARVVAGTLRSVEEGVPFDMEYRMLARDGRVVWLLDRAEVLEFDRIGRPTLFHGVQFDITAQKVAEEAVTANMRDKEQLIQLLAHELFTPMTVIQGAALTLRSAGGGLTGDELAVLVEGVTRGAARLRRLVSHVDAAAKLDRRDMLSPGRPWSPSEILELASQGFQAGEVAAFNISIDPRSELRRPVVDLSLTAQAIAVVMENALDYSGGAPVDIQAAEREGALLVRVADHGPGIPPEEQERIFELFTQVDSSDTRQHGGLGVGLFLSRRIMRLQGGDLEYETGPDGGSIFTFRFPPAQPD